ncbi:hypothetical protein DPEC_G00162320 [Dallia pectoralis]|uniref:Uncharacterized protein n=1 Tax=Dallia pectoralis TaxID=75939 RepID=A0ACC2GGQ2_DALPE|nr:hypothetical protein DPEC_G00162320 [Dallia pectoralis]
MTSVPPCLGLASDAQPPGRPPLRTLPHLSSMVGAAVCAQQMILASHNSKPTNRGGALLGWLVLPGLGRWVSPPGIQIYIWGSSCTRKRQSVSQAQQRGPTLTSCPPETRPGVYPRISAPNGGSLEGTPGG